MPTTYNIISKANSFYQFSDTNQQLSTDSYSHNWTATGATISVSSEQTIYPLQYSLKVQPTSDITNIVLTLNNITSSIAKLLVQSFQFHARFYCSSNLTIETSIHNDQTNETNSHIDTTLPSQWSTGYSPVMDAGEVSISFDVQITISNHLGSVFYMSLPSLVNEQGFYENVFARNLRKNIPSFIWDKDVLETYPTYPFYKLFHVLTNGANNAAQFYSDLFKYSKEQIPPAYSPNVVFGKSILVDADNVNDDYIPWLGQFTGGSILRSINVDGADAVVASGVDPDDFVQWQLENSYFGWNAGTYEAIRESVKQILSDSKICLVFSGGSAFAILIYTLVSQTPGVVNQGDSSDEVLAIANLAKPAGFSLTHSAFTELPFLIGNETYGLLDISPLA